ncbi:hormogonium polysaccharide biosynthesis glycosyltransferase HpsE [Leptothoe sp. PORK10 BA2]|uniref:hormogonium polysaccharide biosynthesis glycosyltransferase HpsE n=1 Tax=Leptothoe sp. PORK10 BA2 TaxID=3110254 RepID=UPI002B203208|nr:hormogonium polysaccharide biosynthesis glycosyltransferase HpsE [Leptothoe sp. PORK10 BA2]MEA5462449.1 hormogonium polysaccharide biosynthesis glycosyltransferase HpsE [Leptothoe sp. PORK10 BA2]
MVDFSVAIRLYNGAAVLPKILEALRAQIIADSVLWEVLIIDNNSVDGTADMVHEYQQRWTVCPLKYVLEPCQGASFARRRAILEAQGTWIGFLDDDNIPDLHWVQSAYDFGRIHPQAAAFGSQVHPNYETQPPANFERIAPFIPVVERDEVVCFTSGWRAMSNLVPPGAGLVILRQAWLDHVPSSLTLRGPVGNSLSCKGEDVEALLYLKKAGWEIWFNPLMHIDHQIPSWRFEQAYLLRFFHGIGLSKYATRMVGIPLWKRPLLILLFMGNDGRKLLLHLIKHHRHLRQDVVAAAELQLLMSSLLSPFYAWRRSLMGPHYSGSGRVAPRVTGSQGSKSELNSELEKKTVLPPHAHGSHLS